MTTKRVFIGMLIALILVLGALIGATYSVTKVLAAQSNKLAVSKANVLDLGTQQTGLVRAKQDVARYAALEKIAKSVVPQDKNQAQTVREITNIAAAHKVPLTTISFPSSTLGAKSSSSAAASAKPNLSQLTPVKGLSGVYNLQITLGNNANNTVSFTQLTTFLQALENNRRTAAVSSLSIQPQANNPGRLVFTLIINTYIKPS